MTEDHPLPRERTAYWVRRIASGGVFLALVLAVLAASILSPTFYQPSNLLNIFRQAAALGILSIAQTMVIIAGGVDLSVAATMQLAVVLMAEITRGDNGRVLPAAAVCLLFGALIGWVNGMIITKRRVPAFVVTLGVSVVVTGARLVLTGGSPSGLLPPMVRVLGGGYVAGVPIILVIFAVLAVVSHILLTKTTFGRRLYARGANTEAARLSGVHVDNVLILTYVITGVVSVLAGLVLAGYLGYADQWIGKGYEFDSIAAVVVGGGSFAGGVGTVGGTVAGVLLVTILVNVVLLLNLNVQYQLIVKGVVLIVAVALQALRRPGV